MQEMDRQRVRAPATLMEVITSLGGPVYGFSAQPHLDAFTATPGLASGRVVKVCVSYTFLRHPDRPDDPRNLVALTPEQRAAITRVERTEALPQWLRDEVRRMRYPTLFEAVRTTLPIPAERAHGLESRLQAHITDALRALLPQQSRPEHLRGPRTAPLAHHVVHRGVPLLVDGHQHRGFRVDVASRLIAVGARLHDRYLTAVIPADLQPLIDLSFSTIDATRQIAVEHQSG